MFSEQNSKLLHRSLCISAKLSLILILIALILQFFIPCGANASGRFTGRIYIDSDWDFSPHNDDTFIENAQVRIYHADKYVEDDLYTYQREDFLLSTPAYEPTLTNKEGRFYFCDIEPGEYTVTIEHIPLVLLNNGYAFNFPLDPWRSLGLENGVHINVYGDSEYSQLVIPRLMVEDDQPVFLLIGLAQEPLEIILERLAQEQESFGADVKNE